MPGASSTGKTPSAPPGVSRVSPNAASSNGQNSNMGSNPSGVYGNTLSAGPPPQRRTSGMPSPAHAGVWTAEDPYDMDHLDIDAPRSSDRRHTGASEGSTTRLAPLLSPSESLSSQNSISGYRDNEQQQQPPPPPPQTVRLPQVRSAVTTPQRSPRAGPSADPSGGATSGGSGRYEDYAPMGRSASSTSNPPVAPLTRNGLPSPPPAHVGVAARQSSPHVTARFATSTSGAGNTMEIPRPPRSRTGSLAEAAPGTHARASASVSGMGSGSHTGSHTGSHAGSHTGSQSGGNTNAYFTRIIRGIQQPPLTLLLFLQSAPPKVIFAAFQAECADWGVHWYSGVAQRVAVYLFLHHPVSRRYPPRSTTLRALLKQYITLIEQPEIALVRKEEEDIGNEDPVDVELMEAYIQCTVSMDGGAADMCYKSYYNVNADNVSACAKAGTQLMLRRLIDGASFPNAAALDPSVFGNLSLGGTGTGVGLHDAANAENDWDTPNPLLSGTPAYNGAYGDSAGIPPPPPVSTSALASHGLVPSPPLHGTRAPSGPFASAPSNILMPLSTHNSTEHANTTGRFVHVGAASSSASTSSSVPTAAVAPPPLLTRQEEEDAINEAHILNAFCSLKVAVGQFSNVGLSLWPAAFVLVQLMAQELRGGSRIFWPRMFHGVSWPPQVPLPVRQRLRILELGAGVGLTPALLNKMQVYRDCVDRFVVTDYQPQLLENIKENLKINRVTEVEDFRAAERGLEGEKERPYHLVSQMDWTHHAQNEASLMDWGANLVLAADCIYDVEVIPALVDTIAMALTAPSPDSIFERAQVMRQRVVVVVQTHRQNSTMKQFFDRLKPFAHVQSFTLLAGKTASELRRVYKISETGDGTDGGIIPLGEWPAEEGTGDGVGTTGLPDFTIGAATDHAVCALRPDTVLEDGSMASIALEPSTPSTLLSAGPSQTYGKGVPHPPRGGGTPQRSPRGTFGPLSPSLSFQNSTNSSFSMDGAGAASRVDALLKDELIGAFYTPMAGLIGVHVIQLKRDAKGAPLSGSSRRPSEEGKGGRAGRTGFGFSPRKE